ncbi:divalent metal cation transporter [Streptomyces lavendulae]|uniref:divalent metal cation transporter n=1 Tax=Streptomyces lavendulae TaxID=1914 RepID=UPI0033CD2D95
MSRGKSNQSSAGVGSLRTILTANPAASVIGSTPRRRRTSRSLRTCSPGSGTTEPSCSWRERPRPRPRERPVPEVDAARRLGRPGFGLRRGITLLSSLIVLFAGVDATQALVWSQVVLSFGIPFALVPRILLTRDGAVMGPWVNRPVTTAAASAVAVLVIGLNLYLVSRIRSG